MGPKSRASIQAAYRKRRDADPTRRELYLNKEHEKYKQDLLRGKRKLISDMTEREARKTRRQWKKRQRRCRLLGAQAAAKTPPASPTQDAEPSSHQSRQKVRGRKQLRREKTAAYRRIKILEAELVKCRKKAEAYKKRYQRCKNKSNSSHCQSQTKMTPRTKTRKLLANFSHNKAAVRKTLVFHYALIDDIKTDTKMVHLSGKIVLLHAY